MHIWRHELTDGMILLCEFLNSFFNSLNITVSLLHLSSIEAVGEEAAKMTLMVSSLN